MNIIRLPLVISSDLAYLSGVFMGDGYLSYRSEKHEYLLNCGGNSKDEKEYYDIVLKNKLKNIFGIEPQMKLFSGGTYGFSIYSKDIVWFFYDLGHPLGRKDYLRIPSILIEKGKVTDFLRGLFDTDGCICFKKKYKKHPFYPVLSISSKHSDFMDEVAFFLLDLGFNVVKTINHKVVDKRAKKGFTCISYVELNGVKNFTLWMKLIGTDNPKHKKKFEKNWKNK